MYLKKCTQRICIFEPVSKTTNYMNNFLSENKQKRTDFRYRQIKFVIGLDYCVT